MNMLLVATAFAAGAMLGLFFFGGLWFTIVRLPTARHPAILALASFWLRAVAVVAGVFFFVERGWQYGLILLAGFGAGRLMTPLLLPERRGPASKCM